MWAGTFICFFKQFFLPLLPLKNPKAAKDAILVLSELAHMVPNKEANNMMAENM